MICPNCQKDQKVGEHNFGALFTCPSCQAVYFINFDGKPEFGDVSTDSFDALNSDSLELNVAAESMGGLTDFPMPEAHSLESLPELGSIEPLVPTNNVLDPISTDPLTEMSGDFNQPTDVISNTIENPFELQNNLDGINSDVAEENSQDDINKMLQAASVAAAEVAAKSAAVKAKAEPTQAKAKSPPAAKPQAASGIFSDIAQELSDFGNTDSNLAGLNYDLIISGIDTQEAKALFKEAIEDSKFAWDSFEIMKSIKNGRVEIKKLTPVKAYLLAKRIQFLDIEKVWKQNVLF